MMLLYDPAADVAQVEIGDVPDGAIDHTEDVSRGPYYTRGIDRGKNGEILGYNFLRASQGVDLEGLPHQQELADLFRRVTKLPVLGAA
ncbi:MAG TPA: hypothetical protein VFH48_39925 [Chloroflexota bacterium]|nr:hypothetical protein [Chloroflexota bacterium]